LNDFNGLFTNEPPWGLMYTSTSSVDGGDLLDPTIITSLPEYSIQLSYMYNSVEHFRM